MPPAFWPSRPARGRRIFPPAFSLPAACAAPVLPDPPPSPGLTQTSVVRTLVGFTHGRGYRDMNLKVGIDDEIYTLNVPDEIVRESGDFFDQMDRDMDAGRQMGREWVAQLDVEDRIRIVGDKLLSALERENHNVGRMMAAYILNRAPAIDTLLLDTTGEIRNTEIRYRSL